MEGLAQRVIPALKKQNNPHSEIRSG